MGMGSYYASFYRQKRIRDAKKVTGPQMSVQKQTSDGLKKGLEALENILNETSKPSISDKLRKKTIQNGYALQDSDVGSELDREYGFGKVLKNDVGKKVYLNNGIFSMENDDQRDKRNSK